MSTQDDMSVIHRKAKVGRSEYDTRAMSPAKALRLSLCRAAERLFGLSVSVSMVEHRTITHAAVKAELADKGLLILLDGADGSPGAVSLDTQFLAALIEVQTTSRVSSGPAAPRPVTRTDAAIVAPMIDVMLRGFDDELTKADTRHRNTGYRFGDRIEDARTLSLMLDAPDYDVFHLSAEIAEGAKTGLLTIVLPKREVRDETDAGEAGGTGKTSRLQQNAMNAPVTLNTVLARISLSLKDICQFEPGSLLPISPECLGETELHATQGHVVACVRLGQLNGFRAIRFLASGAPSQDGENAMAQADAEMPKTAVVDLQESAGSTGRPATPKDRASDTEKEIRLKLENSVNGPAEPEGGDECPERVQDLAAPIAP